jgi:DnaD/phage-associated family protein
LIQLFEEVAVAEAESRNEFPGFPAGRLRATVLPSLFFTEVLGRIDDLGELKLALYLIWRIREKKVYPRYVTRREIESDATVRDGMAALGTDSVREALMRVVNRGLILRRSVELAGARDEWYFLNSASGRRAVEDLEAGRLDLGQIVLPDEPLQSTKRTSIFHLYEQNIGLLTPLIVDELGEAELRYPGDWIEDAFRQAVTYNRRSWRYVQRILERWSNEGKDDEASRGGASPYRHPAAQGNSRRV